MNAKKFEMAKEYARERLERELPPILVYHSLSHTAHEVAPMVEHLAEKEGITGQHRYLLLTAAWFHDLGYAEKIMYHELISARIALEVLPGFGYTKKEVETVRWAIFATILPQMPTSLLEQALTDADLGLLGRENFMQRNQDLRREFESLGKVYSDIEWYKAQVVFLENHQYFTKSARDLRQKGKLENIAKLKQRVKELGG